MLVQTRDDFELMLDAIRSADVMAYDTEGEGLHLRHGDRMIGISIYTDSGQSFYVPFRHGMKDVDADYEQHKKNSAAKKLAVAYAAYNESIRPSVQAANVPIEWLREIADVWLCPRIVIAHNAQHDLTTLDLEGFPLHPCVEDTMSMLSVVNPDWRGNAKEGLYPQFFMRDTGQYEKGSRSLKWQARLWQLEGASEGIDALDQNVQKLSDRLKELTNGLGSLHFTADSAPQSYLWMLHPADVALYAIDDTRLTYLLRDKIYGYSQRWNDTHLLDLYNKITVMVWQMQRQGVQFDLDKAAEMQRKGEAHLKEIEDQIRFASGNMIDNPASPKQILAYLNAIGLKVTSTDKYTLAKIKDVPVVGMLKEYRSLGISLHTFVEKWQENNVDSRIYFEYNVGGTGTGRLSSSSDMFGNAQNLPRVTARSIVNPKMLLFPPNGTIWIDIDYSSLEVNLGAWIAETLVGRGKDMTLTEILEAGADMHTVAMKRSGIYDILLRGRTEEQYLIDNGHDLSEIKESPVEYFKKKIARQTQKTANFASQYGSGVEGIMRAVGCSEDEARAMLDGFHSSFPAIGQAMETLQQLAMKSRPIPGDKTKTAQYIQYPIPALNLSRKYGYYAAEQKTAKGGTWSPIKSAARGAYNSVTQGTGGLIMLASMLRVKDKFGFTRPIDKTNEVEYTEGIVTPLGTVHDSISFALRPQDLQIVPMICDLLSDWPTRPALKVAVSAALPGQSWGEVEDVKNMERWIESGGMER